MKLSTKMRNVMREFKAGKLHSGKGGKVVRSRKQAIAIAISVTNKLRRRQYANR